MITTFHASDSPDLIIEPFHNSRYGFPVLFTTPSAELGKAYKDFRNWKNGNGYIYTITHEPATHTHDFKNQITYSNSFRNLIHKLRHKPVKVIRIANCFDTPYQRIHHHVKADIYAVIDFDAIEEIEKIEV